MAAASLIRAIGALSLTIALVVSAVGCSSASDLVLAGTSRNAAGVSATAVPATKLDTVLDGLDSPSGMAFTPAGDTLIVAGDDIIVLDAQGRTSTLKHDIGDLPDSGNALLDIAVSPDFSTDHTLYVCHRTNDGVRVTQLQTESKLRWARQQGPIVTGIPTPTETTGGCRIAFGPDGYLYVGTSDGGDPTASQSLASLGGKILRIDVETRGAPDDNPFITRADPHSQLIYSYGLRDVVGLAWHPTTDALYALDRGPGREDEVNLIVSGGNYGWNPASASTSDYDTDGVAMTDLSLPQARPAVWSSGTSGAPGVSGATFLSGDTWSAGSGLLIITSSAGVQAMRLTGEVAAQSETLESLENVGATGAIALCASGALYVVTADDGGDRLVRVRVRVR